MNQWQLPIEKKKKKKKKKIQREKRKKERKSRNGFSEINVSLFLLIRVFGLLSSSSFLYSQRFGRYVFQPSSDVCQTYKPNVITSL